ncbi:MarR family transcriptional regulator [Methylobacterium sp. 17Sr1-1]|uniref:MarR family winged helix-turn-helix transcriptional regulator n=1 Tax=Methylobacterium sp. 17Sr1-1 TaxID=2202826 RepID=UPI001FE202A5|nr:MarR family transcriptional regulator [Methylobacterium sp. 17Sr1-1]
MSDIDATPGHLLRRLRRIATAWFAEECATFGLTSVQYAALTAIRENPGVDATRPASLIAFDRSTLGSVLERLAAKGWVLRSPSPRDKVAVRCPGAARRGAGGGPRPAAAPGAPRSRGAGRDGPAAGAARRPSSACRG